MLSQSVLIIQDSARLVDTFQTLIKHGSGAGHSLGPHSGTLLLLWLIMKMWIVNSHLCRNGRPTFWKTFTFVVNHEDIGSSFPFLSKWEAHIMKVNFFLAQ